MSTGERLRRHNKRPAQNSRVHRRGRLGPMTTLLLHLSDVDEAAWAERFRRALPEVSVVRRGETFERAEVDYVFVWKPKPDAFDGLTGLKAVLSLGAGVDALLRHPKLPDCASRPFRRCRPDAADDRLCRSRR